MQYQIPSNLAISENGFIFFPTTGETFTLNPIGNEILTKMKSGIDYDSIVEAVVVEYDVDRGSFERDFNDFLNQLKNFKLIIEK